MRCIAFRSRLSKPKAFQHIALDWQLIEFAAFLLGNLTLPKAFQQIAALFVVFFASRHLTQASL